MSAMSEPRIIKSEKRIFKDCRGTLAESWTSGDGIPPVKCSLLSANEQGALRGYHFQRNNPRAGVVRCVSGIVWDVCVDLRKGSDTYGKYYTNRLVGGNYDSLYIPAGFGHAFYAMTDALVIYEWSENFDPASYSGMHWASNEAVWDGIIRGELLVSEKDKQLPMFHSIEPIEVPNE